MTGPRRRFHRRDCNATDGDTPAMTVTTTTTTGRKMATMTKRKTIVASLFVNFTVSVSMIMAIVTIITLAAAAAATTTHPKTVMAFQQQHHRHRHRHHCLQIPPSSSQSETCRFAQSPDSSSSSSDDQDDGDGDTEDTKYDEADVNLLREFESRKEEIQVETTRQALEDQHTRSFLKRRPKKLPYKQSRLWVQKNLGPDTREEYEDLVENGNLRTPYIPKRPEEYYTTTNDWISWDDYLKGTDDDDGDADADISTINVKNNDGSIWG